MKNITCYIAAPYTNPDPVLNTRIAIDVGISLWESYRIAPIIPHLTMFAHLVRPMPVQDWYDIDIVIMLRGADCVLRLPGESEGADMEVEIAKGNRIPVFTKVLDVVEFQKSGKK